jgi:hypothetical protein
MWRGVVLLLQLVRRASYWNLKKTHLIFRCGKKSSFLLVESVWD